VRTFDNAGNYSAPVTLFTAKYDGTPPTAPADVVDNASDWSNNLTPTFSWSASADSLSGVAGYYYSTSLSPDVFTTSTSVTLGVQPDGSQTFYVRAVDNTGNNSVISNHTFNISTGIPKNPDFPAAESGGMVSGVWQNTDNTPHFTWSGAADTEGGLKGYSVYWGTDPAGEPGTSFGQAAAAYDPGPFSGAYYLRVRTFNNANNYSAPVTLFIAKYDATPPGNPTSCAEAGGAADNGWQNSVSTPVFTWSGASDAGGSGIAGYDYYWGMDPGGTAYNHTVSAGYVPPAVADGVYYLRVRTLDVLGNASAWATIFTFRLDTAVPSKPVVSSVSHPQNTPTASGNAIFSWTASSDPGGSGIARYSYVLDHTADSAVGASTETADTSLSLSSVPDGTWWLHVRGIDLAGNGSEAARYKFIVDTTSPTFTLGTSKSPARQETITVTLLASEPLRQQPAVSVTQNGQDTPAAVAMTTSDNVLWIGSYTVLSGYDGTAVLNVTGVDIAGNTGTRAGSFQADTTGPAASLALLPGASLKTGQFMVSLTINDASAITAPPVLSYSSPGKQPVAVRLRGSDSIWTGIGFIESVMSTGTASFSFSAVDAAGNVGTSISAGGTFQIDTSVSGTAGGTVENSDGTTLVVRPGAYSGDLVVNISPCDRTLYDISAANTNSPAVTTVASQNLCREFSAHDAATGSEVSRFGSPVTLTIDYPDVDNDGFVDGTSIRDRDLRLYWLDSATKRWEEVAGWTADHAAHMLSASVSHFSIYSIMASMPSPVAYPVPWKPGSGGKFDSATVPGCGSGLIFANLPSGTEIRIYNYSGDLVREFAVASSDNHCKAWNGENGSGRAAASGIYLAVIKTPSGKTVRKLAVER
jgi:hypothetical protein